MNEESLRTISKRVSFFHQLVTSILKYLRSTGLGANRDHYHENFEVCWFFLACCRLSKTTVFLKIWRRKSVFVPFDVNLRLSLSSFLWLFCFVLENRAYELRKTFSTQKFASFCTPAYWRSYTPCIVLIELCAWYFQEGSFVSSKSCVH